VYLKYYARESRDGLARMLVSYRATLAKFYESSLQEIISLN